MWVGCGWRGSSRSSSVATGTFSEYESRNVRIAGVGRETNHHRGLLGRPLRRVDFHSVRRDSMRTPWSADSLWQLPKLQGHL